MLLWRLVAVFPVAGKKKEQRKKKKKKTFKLQLHVIVNRVREPCADSVCSLGRGVRGEGGRGGGVEGIHVHAAWLSVAGNWPACVYSVQM